MKAKDVCVIGALTALGVILSAMLQFRLVGDIKVDLSYIVIVIVCYLYGGIYGCLSASFIALLESTLFGAYGVSISWITANFIIGLLSGFVLNYRKKQGVIKAIIDVSTIIVSCAIGLLLVKTLIECKLYGIPFPVKIVKNAVAFGVDCACMILGYFIVLPRVLKSRKYNIPRKEQKTNFNAKDGEEE